MAHGKAAPCESLECEAAGGKTGRREFSFGEAIFVNEESLFAAALECKPGPDRLAYLAEACGGDSDLRQRLDRLLAAHERAAGLI